MKERKLTLFRRYSLIFGVLIIPVIYSLCYLQAYWNPYTRVNQLPVALVNLDQGAVIQGKPENLGRELEDTLRRDKPLNCSFVTASRAAAALEKGDFYAVITIPENFTETIASAGGRSHASAEIRFDVNQKHNYIAALMLRSAVNSVASGISSNVSRTVTAGLVQQLNTVPAQLNALASGLSDIHRGAGSLYDGIRRLQTGQHQAALGTDALAAGLGAVSAGSRQLEQGVALVSDNTTALAAGTAKLAASLHLLTSGTPGRQNVQSGNPVASPDILQISASLDALADKLEKTAQAAQRLNAGAASVSAGAKEALAGAEKLRAGSAGLETGTQTLEEGAAALLAGTDAAGKRVADSSAAASAGLTATGGLDTFAARPVTVREDVVHPVSSYGEAFAPFFIPLSLWVGALMLFFGIHFDWMRRIRILTPHSEFTLLRTLIFLVLGACQGLTLALVLRHTLNLQIASPGLYYGACVLFSLVAVSIVQFLIVQLGDFGKLLAILLLILSLTSAGGTFPMETISGGFDRVGRFVPMTYGVDLLRQALVDRDAGQMRRDILILGALAAVFAALTLLLLFYREQKNRRLHPENDLFTENEDAVMADR